VADIQLLFDHNREWAARLEKNDPGFFSRLVEQQAPEYLWIGCSDSRVPANVITGLVPGAVFVHRNVANVVSLTDINCMSAVEYAIRSLQVKHVIVCGHYGCGGVQAALEGGAEGTVGDWLKPIQELVKTHESELSALDTTAAARRLCELNVLHQVQSLSNSDAVRGAWTSGQALTIHAWIYGIEDGLLRSLQEPVSAPSQS
jgi:carbonic anhydrase